MTINKFYSDHFLHLKALSNILEIPIGVLKSIEVEFLWLLDFEVTISTDDYLDTLVTLKQFFRPAAADMSARILEEF